MWNAETCCRIYNVWRIYFVHVKLVLQTDHHTMRGIYNIKKITVCIYSISRSQRPRGLRRRTTAARLLRLWVRIPPGGMDVCLLWVLSGRNLCLGLITRPEESYRLWWVVVCDIQTSIMRRPWPTGGCCVKLYIYIYIYITHTHTHTHTVLS